MITTMAQVGEIMGTLTDSLDALAKTLGLPRA
jgi:hypothetical protein